MRWLVRVEGGPGDPPYDCVVLKHGGTENTEEPVARFSIPYSLCVSVPLCFPRPRKVAPSPGVLP